MLLQFDLLKSAGSTRCAGIHVVNTGDLATTGPLFGAFLFLFLLEHLFEQRAVFGFVAVLHATAFGARGHDSGR